MNINFAEWSLILLCFSMACAIGGGLYEHIVRSPIWSASPPASFAIIQPRTGVPLQRFWMPVHAGITVFVILGLALTWGHEEVRRLLLIGLGSYIIMRVWSGFFFIREMLAFQKVPTSSPPRPQSFQRESLAGPFGVGSGNLWTSSRSCVSCWLSRRWPDRLKKARQRAAVWGISIVSGLVRDGRSLGRTCSSSSGRSAAGGRPTVSLDTPASGRSHRSSAEAGTS